MKNLAISIVLLALLTVAGIPALAQDPVSQYPIDPDNVASQGIPSVAEVTDKKLWSQCAEYLPKQVTSQCRVDFDMAQTKDGKNPPQVHRDISVQLGGTNRAVVALWHSSPFAACSLSTTPGPLGRDLSPNVGGALTSASTLAGFGGVVGLPPAVVDGASVPMDALDFQFSSKDLAAVANESIPAGQSKLDLKARIGSLSGDRFSIGDASKEVHATLSAPDAATFETALKEKQKGEVAKIQKLENAVLAAIAAFKKDVQLYSNFAPDRDDLKTIREALAYAYESDEIANNSMTVIDSAASRVVGRPLPDSKLVADMQTQSDAINSNMNELKEKYGTQPKVQTFLEKNSPTADAISSQLNPKDPNSYNSPKMISDAAYLTDTQAKVEKIMDFVKDWKAKNSDLLKHADASVQILPIAIYPEDKVTVQVKCVDAVTSAALFDTIQFNAYFQKPPVFDISSGVLISTLHGRQPTVQSEAYSAGSSGSTPTSPSDEIVVNKTPVQFMPGVFAEWHPKNFKLPGVHDPAIDKQADLPNSIPTWMSDHAARHPLGYVGSFGLAGGFMVNPNNGAATAEFFEGVSFGVQRFVFLLGNHTGRSQNLINGYYLGETVPSGTTVPTVSNWRNAPAFGITYRIPLR